MRVRSSSQAGRASTSLALTSHRCRYQRPRGGVTWRLRVGSGVADGPSARDARPLDQLVMAAMRGGPLGDLSMRRGKGVLECPSKVTRCRSGPALQRPRRGSIQLDARAVEREKDSCQKGEADERPEEPNQSPSQVQADDGAHLTIRRPGPPGTCAGALRPAARRRQPARGTRPQARPATFPTGQRSIRRSRCQSAPTTPRVRSGSCQV